MIYIANYLNAFLLSVVLVMASRKFAVFVGLLDRPTQRKTHIGLVPLNGGLAMFAAFALSISLMGQPVRGTEALLAGLFLLVVVGAIDDYRELPPIKKLVLQCAAATLIIVPGWRVVGSVGYLLGSAPLQLGSFALPVSIIFVVGLINAINMVDGVDGLAGGVVAAMLFWFALIAASIDRDSDLVVILLLFFVIVGFLVFNLRTPWHRTASVFMGDAGSMMLGASVAYFAITLVTTSGAEVKAANSASLPAIAWLLALPVIDTLSLIVRRLCAGRSPFSSDRLHLHHLLIDTGFSPAQVTAFLVAVATVLGGIGFAGVVLRVPDPVMGFGLLIPLAVHTAYVRRSPKQVRKSGLLEARDVAVLR